MSNILSEKDDRVLIELFRQGDTRAFGTIIEKYSVKLNKQLFPLVNDSLLIEDLLQDTFIKAIHAIQKGSYIEEGNLGAWLARVANNLAMDYFRTVKRHPMVYVSQDTIYTEEYSFARIESDDPNPEQIFMNSQADYDIEDLLDQLPAEQKEVIVLRIFQDFSFKEIADFTGESINTCLGRMRYGLINLRKRIGCIRESGTTKPDKLAQANTEEFLEDTKSRELHRMYLATQLNEMAAEAGKTIVYPNPEEDRFRESERKYWAEVLHQQQKNQT